MKFKLIKLTSDRINDYLELDNRCFSKHYNDTMSTYDSIFNELKKSDIFIYIGVNDINDINEIVCSLYLQLYKNQKCLQIKSICVSENYRNRKIASYLLEFSEKFAKQNNLEFIFLITNKSNNTIVLNLYEKYGYTESTIKSKFIDRIRLFKNIK